MPDIDVATLQWIAARGWPAVETEPLGGWLLRAAGGFTRRANSVLAFHPLGVPIDDALAHVAQWYEARGLPAYVQLAQDTPLDAELASRAWTAEAPVHFQIAPIDVVWRAFGEGGSDTVELADAPDAAWLAGYHKAGTVDASTLHVIRGGPTVGFATVRGDEPGHAKAIGRCVIVDGWAGFSAIEVDPAHRRRGLAVTVMRALVGWASELGATGTYLQVEADNGPALALYERLGFTTHHHCHYRRCPSPQQLTSS